MQHESRYGANDGEFSPARRHRILALVTDAYGGYGGIAQYNRDFVTALSKDPKTASICILPRLTPGVVEELPAKVRQQTPTLGRVAYAVSAFLSATVYRPTIIFNGHLYHSPLAHLLAKLSGAKLISQLHGTEIWGKLSQRHKVALEASDLVLAVSRDTRARVLAKTDLAPEKVVVLNNTVGHDFVPAEQKLARRHFGLTDELVVLTVARLDSRDGYKGHDRIIPLVPQIGAGAKVRYLIAGIGDDRNRLEKMARAYGVEQSVIFLGKVSREKLADLYRSADLFALPSTGEGFGIAFLEAMACGTRTIGLDCGGASDALGDGQLGVCIPETEFTPTFLRLLKQNLSSDAALSTSVHARFGFSSFQEHCHRLLNLLC